MVLIHDSPTIRFLTDAIYEEIYMDTPRSTCIDKDIKDEANIYLNVYLETTDYYVDKDKLSRSIYQYITSLLKDFIQELIGLKIDVKSLKSVRIHKTDGLIVIHLQ